MNRVHKKVSKDLNEIKMKTCFDYFNKIRSDLMNDAYIKIVYHWKKYKVSYKIEIIL